MRRLFSSALFVGALATASFLISTPAHAETVSFEYELSVNDPATSSWPLQNPCHEWNAWSSTEKRVVQMEALVSETGLYNFSDQYPSGPYQNGRIVLLSTAFNESDPGNCLFTIDDAGSVELQAGTTYRLGLTSFDNNVTGSFSFQTSGPGTFDVVGLSDSALLVDPVTVDADTPVLLTATPVSKLLNVDLSGTVTFSIDGVQVGQSSVGQMTGEASFDAGIWPAGDYEISASYGGVPAKTRSSSGTSTLTVNSLPTTTTLTAAPKSLSAGEATTLTATVAGSSPTGSVEFFNGINSLGVSSVSLGRADLAVTLPLGIHRLTAVYSGDAAHTASTSLAVEVTVTPVRTPGAQGPAGQQLAKTGVETPGRAGPLVAAAAILAGLILITTRRRAVIAAAIGSQTDSTGPEVTNSVD